MAATLDLGNLLVHMKMDASQYMNAMRSVEARMRKTSQRLTAIGKQMTMKVTLPLAIMGGVAIKTMADLESAFTGVRKTVDATEEEFTQLRIGFEKMSTVIPISIKELYGIGEAAGQLGIQTKNILKFSRVMADLGVTTNLTAQEASMALARFANITQMSQGDFDRLGSTIVDLGNNLATTEAEIVMLGLRLSGAGKVVGLTEDAIMSLAAAVSSAGVRAEAGGTAMSRVLLDMSTYVKQGAAELEGLAKVAGVTTKEFSSSFEQNASMAVYSFVKGLYRLREAGVDVAQVLKTFGWGGMRIRDVLLRLSGASNVLKDSLEIGSKAWEENTALTREAELRYGTFASQVIMLKNRLVLIAKEIGLMLKPTILKLMDAIKRMIVYWNLMEDSVKRNILIFAGMAAAIGPVLLATGLLLKSLTFMIATVGTLTSSFAGLTAAMFGPIGVALLLAAIAYALRAAWNQNLKAIKDRMQELFDSFKVGFDWLRGTILVRFLVWFGEEFQRTFKYVKSEFGAFLSDIAGMWQGSVTWLKKMSEGVVEAWQAPTFNQMIDDFKKGWEEAGNAFAFSFVEGSNRATNALEAFKKSVREGYETTGIYLEAFGEATVEHLQELLNAVKIQFGQDADALIALIKSKMLKVETPLGLTPADVSEVEEAVKKLGEQLDKLNEGIKDPTPLEQWMSNAQDVSTRVSEAFAHAFQRMGDELADFLVEGKANFKDFAKSILKDLLAIYMRAQIVIPLAMALGFIPTSTNAPGLSTPGSSTFTSGGVSTTHFHKGGLVGAGGMPQRMVPAATFIGAPRLHGGLAPDEFPSILQRGETVIPRGGGAAPTIIINNNTGQPLKQEGTPSFNGKEWVIGIVTEEINQYGSLRNTIQGIGQSG